MQNLFNHSQLINSNTKPILFLNFRFYFFRTDLPPKPILPMSFKYVYPHWYAQTGKMKNQYNKDYLKIHI